MAQIKIQNAKKVQELFRALPNSMKEVGLDLIRREFEVAVKDAQVIANSHYYNGDLAAGIKLDLIEGKYHYRSTAPHSAFAEFGTKEMYQRRPGFEKWAQQFRKKQINTSGTPKERIYEWASRRQIPKKFWFAVYKKIMDRGMNAIGVNNNGFFIAPYNDAKLRIVKKLKTLLADALKK